MTLFQRPRLSNYLNYKKTYLEESFNNNSIETCIDNRNKFKRNIYSGKQNYKYRHYKYSHLSYIESYNVFNSAELRMSC